MITVWRKVRKRSPGFGGFIVGGMIGLATTSVPPVAIAAGFYSLFGLIGLDSSGRSNSSY